MVLLGFSIEFGSLVGGYSILSSLYLVIRSLMTGLGVLKYFLRLTVHYSLVFIRMTRFVRSVRHNIDS